MSILGLLGGGGGGSGFRPVGLDLSFLATASQAPADPGLSARARRAAEAFTTPVVTAPWQLDSTPRSLAERLGEARSLRSFINTRDDAVAAAGSNADLRSTFALFKALDALRTLAQYASERATPTSALADVDAQFQRGMAEVQSFVASNRGEQLTLLYGPKKSKVETTVTVPRSPTSFTGRAVQTGGRGDVLSGLTGSERFDITLTKANRTDTVRVDLSTISGPITLDAIAEAANAAITAEIVRDDDGNPVLDGEGNPTPRYLTRFDVVKDAKGDWGLRVRASLTESVSLSDPDGQPSLMMLGTTRGATGGPTRSVLSEITDLNGAMTRSQRADLTGINGAATTLQARLFEEGQDKKEADAKARNLPFIADTAPGAVVAPTVQRAIAVDSQGFSYTVGTSSGDVGNQSGSGRDDLVLSKTDSDGRVVWTRRLGGSGVAEGFSVTVDGQDNIIVAGQTTGRIGSRDIVAGQDTLVVKFNSRGEERFATQLDSVVTDGARAVTVADDGTIFIAGETRGSLPGQTSQGGLDLFVARLNATTGVMEQRQQLGTTGADSVGGLAIDGSGALVLASTEAGRAVVRRIDAADLAVTLDQADLGDLGPSGRVSALTIDRTSGTIAIGGSTRSALENVGDETGALEDGGDAFVARLDAGLEGQGVTYLSTSNSDRVDSLAFVGDRLFALGRTNGDLGGTRAGPTDSFLARLDSDGGVEAIQQYGAGLTRTEPAALAVVDRGPGVLSTLGLRAGTLNPTESTSLVQQTPLRAGDQFSIAVDGGPARRVTIQANDTLRSLALRINTLFPGRITASALDGSAGTRLSITPKEGFEIDLRAGPAGQDALAKLGLEPTKLVDSQRLFGVSGEDEEQVGALRPGGTFALGLERSFSVGDKKAAEFTLRQIESAISTVQRATRALYFDPIKARIAEESGRGGRTGGTVPAFLTNQIASYSAALQRLQGASFGGGGGGLF